MYKRRSVSISREGVYYLFVLAFIVGGATLRDINLLFVLAGMMLGPLLYNWRMVALSMRRLSIERGVPKFVTAGQAFRVEIHGTNRRKRLGSWVLAVEDLVRPDTVPDNPARGPDTAAGVILPYLAAGHSDRVAYRLMLPQRGCYQFGPLSVSTRFPLGLVKATARLAQFRKITVGPRLGHLKPHWVRLLESKRMGRYPMQYRQGPIDGDYYGIRQWRSGDSKRWIHWRSTAKLRRLSVRQFEQQTDCDLAILLDLWIPDEPTEEDQFRVEMVVSFAATAIDELTRRGSSRLTVGLSAKQTDVWTGRATGVFGRQIMERLAMVHGSPDDHVMELLGDMIVNVPLGARVLVVSTRSDRLEQIQQNEHFEAKLRHQRALSNVIWLHADSPQMREVFEVT